MFNEFYRHHSFKIDSFYLGIDKFTYPFEVFVFLNGFVFYVLGFSHGNNYLLVSCCKYCIEYSFFKFSHSADRKVFIFLQVLSFNRILPHEIVASYSKISLIISASFFLFLLIFKLLNNVLYLSKTFFNLDTKIECLIDCCNNTIGIVSCMKKINTLS